MAGERGEAFFPGRFEIASGADEDGDVHQRPLAVGDDGSIYGRLAGQAIRWLRDGGALAVEIDARRGEDEDGR